MPSTLNLSGLSVASEDLLVLENGVFGPDSSGDWALYFDGSDSGLGGDNVWGSSIDANTGDLYLTTRNGFSLDGVGGNNLSGDGNDILQCQPLSLGAETDCSISIVLDGETQGVAANQSFDGIQVGQLTGNEVFGDQVIYMSMVGNSTVGGIVLADEDIFSHDLRTGAWNVFFDGSDVGIATDVDAFHIQDDGSVLMSFNTTTAVAGVGNVDSRDIVRFIPTSTGEQTAGSFEIYFDGSDVGLTTSSEGIDAIGFTPEGTLLISTSGAYSVNGVSGKDTDLLAFTASQLGADTAGIWELYVDGSDVELTSSAEDITGTWVDPDSGVIHFTTLGNVSSGGVSGTRNDILTCTAQTLGANTACDMAFFYSGGDNGITQGLDGIHVRLIPSGSQNAPAALKSASAGDVESNQLLRSVRIVLPPPSARVTSVDVRSPPLESDAEASVAERVTLTAGADDMPLKSVTNVTREDDPTNLPMSAVDQLLSDRNFMDEMETR